MNYMRQNQCLSNYYTIRLMLTRIQTKIESLFSYKKRKAIEDWDFIMVFEEHYRQEVEMIFNCIECKDQVQWKHISHKESKKSLFLLKMSDQVVEDMAHNLKILKKKDKKSFKMGLKEINSLIYTMGEEQTSSAYDYLCFIRSRLYPKNKEIYDQEQYSAFNKKKKEQYILGKNGELFTEEEKLRAKYHFLLTYSEKLGDDANKQFSVVTREPFAQLMKHPGFEELIPIQKVSQHKPFIMGSLKDYMGPNIDCYFDFVQFLQKWLWFPMVVGLATIALNYYLEYTVDNSPFDFFYAWAIMIWSVLFITRWEEIHNWIKIKETPGCSQDWSQHQNIVSRRGMEKRISPVTGQAEYHLPMKDRILLQLASNGVFISITIITMVFMVLSLNLRGFIDPQHKLFYSETLSGMAAPGGIFDAKTGRGQIPNILHVVITNGFDEMVYRPLAKKLAKFERHRSTKGYENSIIIKYFIYEFLITFADLFYIAFVRLDIEGLREQLFSLFFIDIIRRLVAESLLPWVKKTLRSRSLKKNYENETLSYEEELEKGAILEADKEPYEQFDDYLEIITNFGYLVMISSCFPLAPLLILVAHEVEILQDKYKIVHIFKRKLPQNYVGMGRWKNIIVFMCYISIITNIMLFAFSSEQVTSVFPKLFNGGKDLIYGNTDLTTLFGGAATGLLQTMMDMGNISSFTPDNWGEGWDFADAANQTVTTGTTDTSAQLSDQAIGNLFGLPINKAEVKVEEKEKVQEPISLQSFKPPNKDSQVTFIAILFFIQHFFLILFIVLRDMLKKRKSEADIFLERRDYKRKIKKNLPKDILAMITAGSLIDKFFKQEAGKSGESLIAGLISKTEKESEMLPSMTEQEQTSGEHHLSSMLKKQSQLSGDGFLLEQEGEEERSRRSLLEQLVQKKMV